MVCSPVTTGIPGHRLKHTHNYLRSKDNDTALSAVRNLNGQDVGGRPLRIDLADSDPFLEGKTTVRGELLDATETRAQWRERERHRFRSDPFLANLPSGVPVPPGQNALDQISRVLAGVQPSEVLEVLAQMKVKIFRFLSRLFLCSPSTYRRSSSHIQTRPAHYLLHTPSSGTRSSRRCC